MGFSCGTLTDRSDPKVVWVVGEVDLAVAARLGAEIEQHLVRGSTVALDCAGITFMDSSGVQVLTHASRAADQAEAGFMLVTVTRPLREVLASSGLSSAFTVVDNLTRAAAEASRR